MDKIKQLWGKPAWQFHWIETLLYFTIWAGECIRQRRLIHWETYTERS